MKTKIGVEAVFIMNNHWNNKIKICRKKKYIYLYKIIIN